MASFPGYVAPAGGSPLGAGTVLSGHLASGAVNWTNLSSGVVRSGHVANAAVNSGNIASGSIGSVHIQDATILTIDIASGQIQSGQLGSGTVTGQGGGGAFNIASGTIITNDLGSGAIVSGLIASGQIGRFHIASGQLAGFELGSGAIVSGRIASGQVGFGHLANASVQSGTIASGQVFKFHFASGTTIDSSEWLIEDTFTAGEIISGATIACAVAFTQSGIIQTAMASVSGRMPAVGIVTANVASGGTVTAYRGGRVFAAALSFSGWMNQPVYVGRSGQLSASGAPTSSGDIQQIMGVTANQSGMIVQIGDALEQVIAGSGDIGSGSVTGQAGGGYFSIASGTVTTNDLSSGCIQSGQISSGVIGRFHIASGQLAGFELGSGAIVSGRVASGVIGFGHLANASVQSGTLASGQVFTYHHSSGSAAPVAQSVAPIYSGTPWTMITGEVVSGVKAVTISPSGFIWIAMAATSGRTPAIGIVVDNVASGIQANVFTDGFFQGSSGMHDFSGYIGRPLWLGRSGQVTTISGSWSSGGFASGDIGERLGIAANSGAIFLGVANVTWSGGPLGIGAGGIV